MQTTLGKFGLMDTSESVFVRNTSVLYVVWLYGLDSR